LLTDSGDLPGGSDGPSYGTLARPAGVLRRLQRHPIWSCSVRGFACHRRCRRRGALLPHLFTLTPRLGAYAPRSGRYIFCATGPSSYPARALPGALPFGVRTFLSPRHYAGTAVTGSSDRL